MTDYTELKVLAEACVAAGEYLPEKAWEEDRSYGPDEEAFLAFVAVATPAAVLALIAENERLRQFEEAQSCWLEKTEWVQKTCHWSELGKHRADVLRERIEQFQEGFKNFHRSICERFGYFHDEADWQRDQVSLEEHIATQFSHVSAENAALRGQVEALQRGAGQLQEENEALRKERDKLAEDKQGLLEDFAGCL